MSQVMANPEELRAFARRLGQCAENVGDEVESTAAAFDSLSDSWNDRKREEFEEVFFALRDSIHRFKDACEDQIPYLLALADHLEDYNSVR